MEGLQATAQESIVAADQQFHLVSSSLAKLLETARRELGRDQDAAKAALVTARSSAVQAQTAPQGAVWRPGRSFACELTLIAIYTEPFTSGISVLSRVEARGHFSCKFKLAVGDSPHAYVVRRRLERACQLMMTSAERLSEIALSVGFSDQAHLCRLFRRAFGQSPANWRRERG